MTSVDRAALSAYCAAWSRWISAEENVQRFGAVIRSPKTGFPIQNPHVGVANTALQIMHRFLIEFGMTPSSRARLSVEAAPKSADPFTEFMASIGGAEVDGAEVIFDDDEAEQNIRAESN